MFQVFVSDILQITQRKMFFFFFSSWRWEVYKTQTSATAIISEEASYSLCDMLEKQQIVNHYCKCADMSLSGKYRNLSTRISM